MTLYTQQNRMRPSLMSDTLYLKWKLTPKSIPTATQCVAIAMLLSSLREHHQSILAYIQYRLAGDITKTYVIKNSWTMKAEDTISTLQRLRGGNDEAVVVKGREEEQTEESLASDYFMLSSIERDRRLLDEKRVKSIARRMDMIAKGAERELGVEYRVNIQEVEKKSATKSPEEVKVMLGQEQCCMEWLLVCEVRGWEKLFWTRLTTIGWKKRRG